MSVERKAVTPPGSLRKGSFNAMVARTLPRLAPAGMGITPLPSIANIPLYDADIQQEEGFPESVRELAEHIRAADGVVIVTPEYNYSVPGGVYLTEQPHSAVRLHEIIQKCTQKTCGGELKSNAKPVVPAQR